MVESVLVSHRACTRCGAPYRNDFARCPVDGAEIADLAADPLIGAAVAHYVIEGLVGEGGMGRVYRARHARLSHRRVALKVMLGELAATLATRLRFSQEAEAASRLDHPNVVSVIDFGRTSDGLMYLAMELVEGRPLSALIDEGPMAADRVVALVKQMCAGLAHAHERGFVHRDFKPDNVMVVDGAAGEVARIVDFGLAIAADPASDAPRVTTVGLALGTPAYAAPEQVHGDSVDHRADLFALGVTMFEMLAGVPPAVGTVRELIERHARGVVPTIAERAPGVNAPPALEALVRRLMASAPDARPQSIAEVLEALERPHPPPPINVEIPAVTARPRRTAHVVAPLVLLGAVGLALWLIPSGDGAPAVAAAPAAVVDARPPVARPAPSPPPVLPRAEARPVVSARTEPAPRGPSEKSEPSKKIEKRGARRERTRPPAELIDSPPAETVAPLAPAISEPPPVAPAVPEAPVAPIPRLPPPAPRPAPPAPVVVATRASARLGAITVTGSLTSGTVKRALDRALPAATSCYGEAARRAGRSPTVDVSIRLTIDENRSSREIRVTAPALPGVSACIADALAAVRTDIAPDVGTVGVSFAIRLIPEVP